MNRVLSAQARKWLRMKKKIYVCAPFGEDVETELENSVRYYDFTLKSDCVPVGPHALAKMIGDRNTVDVKQMRQAGMSLLWFCDEIWVFGEQTESMQDEIRFGKNMKIRMRKISEKEIRKIVGGLWKNEKETLDHFDWRTRAGLHCSGVYDFGCSSIGRHG